ncbi:hypothetical protein [Mycolicibacterium sp. YH-1]|uniref:hypothetical protein n=1 Tax=Mycolicibacterium sp. YH-1 TaxID=2908837 RepID=UPI001F4C04CF|nr:hypothetical protein [Mycolicibacterium sp. YH-1]UNB52796.1 hypothetical protein L0M16_34050 [Mycolicibacterium sp. YH-1]
MNPWQQQPGPNWDPPPPGPPQQPYPPGPYPPQPYASPGYQHPGYPQQYPGYPYPPPRPASSGAAVTAIVLSLIIALFQAFACIGYIALASEISDAGNAVREWVPGFLIFEGMVRILTAAVLVVGAVLLMRRNPAGRWVVAGAALAIVVFQFLEYAVRSGVLPTSDASPLSTLISVILPITLIVFALTGATRRWIDEGRLRR